MSTKHNTSRSCTQRQVWTWGTYYQIHNMLSSNEEVSGGGGYQCYQMTQLPDNCWGKSPNLPILTLIHLYQIHTVKKHQQGLGYARIMGQLLGNWCTNRLYATAIVITPTGTRVRASLGNYLTIVVATLQICRNWLSYMYIMKNSF